MAWIRKAIVDQMQKIALGLTPEDLDLNFLSGKGELRNLGMFMMYGTFPYFGFLINVREMHQNRH